MLGKLLKYDLKANRNLFLLMYGVLLAIALGTRMVIGSMVRDLEGYSGLGIMAAFLLMSFFMAVVVISVLGYILVIRRFYQHLFSGEGYLTFTLPVTASQHFASKVISGMFWLFASLLVQAAGLLILAAGALKHEIVKEVLSVMTELYEPFFGSGDFVWQIIFAVFNSVVSLMMIYFAVCLGQMSRRRRVLSSVVWYFGLSFLFNMIAGAATEMFINVDIMGDVLVTYEIGYYVMNTVVMLLKAIVFAGGSILIMQKKLNLE